MAKTPEPVDPEKETEKETGEIVKDIIRNCKSAEAYASAVDDRMYVLQKRLKKMR